VMLADAGDRAHPRWRRRRRPASGEAAGCARFHLVSRPLAGRARRLV